MSAKTWDPKMHRPAWAGTLTAKATPAPVRALHLHIGRDYGGLERLLHCLGERREEAPGMEPVFALGYHHRLAREIIGSGGRVEVIGSFGGRRPWNAPSVWNRVSKILTRERFDAVICHGSSALANFGWLAHRRGVPLVHWMHSDTKVRNRNPAEVVAGLSRPGLAICNSTFTQESLPLLFGRPTPNVIIHCPVSQPPAYANAGEIRRKLRAENGAFDDEAVIILPSRLEAWKGHAQLVDALGKLAAVPGWKCWIAGGPFFEDQARFLESLKAGAARLGIADRVRFLGQRSDVPDLMIAADIFCQPNLTPEPFGVNAIEALYAGLPVVASDSGGTREIVDASCGRLTPLGDIEALARELEALVRDPALRRRLAEAAPARGVRISDPARILPELHGHLAALSAYSGQRHHREAVHAA